MDEKKNPLELLPPEHKARLRSLVEEVAVDRLTVSFSIEARDHDGVKKSTFFSLSAKRKDVDGIPGEGYSLQDAELMRCLLSKQVVRSTYVDAIDRRIIPNSPGVREELGSILNAYDQRIVQALTPKKAE